MLVCGKEGQALPSGRCVPTDGFTPRPPPLTAVLLDPVGGLLLLSPPSALTLLQAASWGDHLNGSGGGGGSADHDLKVPLYHRSPAGSPPALSPGGGAGRGGGDGGKPLWVSPSFLVTDAGYPKDPFFFSGIRLSGPPDAASSPLLHRRESGSLSGTEVQLLSRRESLCGTAERMPTIPSVGSMGSNVTGAGGGVGASGASASGAGSAGSGFGGSSRRGGGGSSPAAGSSSATVSDTSGVGGAGAEHCAAAAAAHDEGSELRDHPHPHHHHHSRHHSASQPLLCEADLIRLASMNMDDVSVDELGGGGTPGCGGNGGGGGAGGDPGGFWGALLPLAGQSQGGLDVVGMGAHVS